MTQVEDDFRPLLAHAAFLGDHVEGMKTAARKGDLEHYMDALLYAFGRLDEAHKAAVKLRDR
jgi:hypothetical protein